MSQAIPIVTPAGEELVLLPKADYERLVDAAEELADIAALTESNRRLASGEEEMLPAAMVDRLLAGESALRGWRGHCGLSQAYVRQL